MAYSSRNYFNFRKLCGLAECSRVQKKGYISSSKKETEKKMPKDNIMKVNEQEYVIPQDIVSKIEITINKDIICIKIKIIERCC